MRLRECLVATCLALAYASVSLGAVTAEEAKKLGTTLTAVGAEKAGNADGTIPPYTGGLTTPPTGYKPGSGIRPDPFAHEKPVFSISAKNLNQYADKLTEGTKALMKKNPSFRIDVYPTHRTAAMPKYVHTGTARNAVTAQTANGGVSVRNVKSGIPFPMPKDGYEAMWNHLLRFDGEAFEFKFTVWNVDASGRRTLSSKGIEIQEYPYYDQKKPSTEHSMFLKVTYLEPARRSGESIMFYDPLDFASKGRRAWQYLPGQRRVKLAPDIGFDGPDPSTAGTGTYDDNFIFNGSLERFDWKLVGKKEMYVPYNAYKMVYEVKADKMCLPKFLNPDYVRWELHRVWVVEATLKPGKRHIYRKRVYYLDEDSWAALAVDKYDARGQLFRTGYSSMTQSYDVPAPLSDPCVFYDLIAGGYCFAISLADDGYLRYIKPLPARDWSPDSLAGNGVR
ncbi:DUF1329 domain-containing protein [Geobacter argillaceus]|uniref:Uncharacterized protein DUF1329 n=1 Tax=Geobacter argillaceus TaxID=345631 RepID=A0A562VID9_9BACT|nr:DUF1329 domain-containing protein [Geobacter argillaceus]TWJ17487.1 uncharacterized protein DUF1329 [Geobacter argillaceus]